MVKEYSLATRHRAVGMVRGGMTQASVAQTLGVSVSTMKIWMARVWLEIKDSPSETGPVEDERPS